MNEPASWRRPDPVRRALQMRSPISGRCGRRFLHVAHRSRVPLHDLDEWDVAGHTGSDGDESVAVVEMEDEIPHLLPLRQRAIEEGGQDRRHIETASSSITSGRRAT
jgi:hypothetical protein